tara:strand:+ start:10464 stop:12215 length:1752 start_codon:yes stop_codon:yes gene_type:complete
MGYKPSLSDLPPVKAVGYTPSMSDLPMASPQDGFIHGLADSALSIPGDVATGVAKGTSGLLGLIPGVHSLEEKTGLAPENMGNPSTLAGVQPNAVDKFITGAASYIPTALGGEASIPARLAEGVAGTVGKNSLLGAAYNQSQGENPLVGAAVGGLLNPELAQAGARFASAPAKAIGKKVGSFVTPDVMKNFFSQQDAPEDVLSSAEHQLRGNYNDVKGISNAKYAAAQSAASMADKSLGTGQKSALSYQVNPFSNHEYVKSLGDIKGGLEKDAASPQAIAKVNQWIENAPHTFSDAIDARKSINSANVNYTDPSYDALKSAADKSRASLVNMVNRNVAAHPNNDEVQGFAGAWKDANDHYATQVAPFTQTFNKANVLVHNKPLAQALKLDTPTTNGDLLKQFMPSSGSNNVTNLQHMADLLRDPDSAQAASRTLLLGKGYNQDGTPGASFLNKYKNLSPNVKQTLFSGEEKEALDNAQSASGKIAGTKRAGLLKGAAGALLGGAGLHSIGVPAEFAYPASIAAATQAKAAARLALSPKSLGHYNNLFKGEATPETAQLQSHPNLNALANKPLMSLGLWQGANQ